MKLKIMSVISLIALIILSACAGSKPQVQPEPVPVRNPLALAHQAAADGNDAYSEKLYNEAIMAFTEAIALFNEAAPTAAPTDSIPLNIEKMNLNIAKSHVDLAVANTDQKLYEEAIFNYEKALGVYKSLSPVVITQEELDANILGVYNNLAIVSKDAGKYQATLDYYDQMLKLKPNDPTILNSKFFLLRDDLKDEARAYTVLLDLAVATNDPAAYINLADRYAEKGNSIEAGKYYLKALELQPGADMYRRLANFYRGNKDWANANVYLEKLVETKPESGELAKVYQMIGNNYQELKNDKKMVEYLDKSLALDRDPQVALALASYYNSAKNYAKVINYATITLSTDSRNVDALMLRGLAYYNSKPKNYAAAKADLGRIQNDPKYGATVKKIMADPKMK